MPETAIAIDTLHSSVDKDSKVVPGTQDLQSDATTANLSVSGTESRPSADDDKTTSIDTVTDSISKLSVNPSPPVSTPLAEPSATTTITESQKDSSETGPKVAVTKVPAKEEDKEEELSPEEAKLRAKGLKSTHRPGFYIHIDAPRRLRIQTSTTTYDLDRYCPHANADMLKWVSSNTTFFLIAWLHLVTSWFLF